MVPRKVNTATQNACDVCALPVHTCEWAGFCEPCRAGMLLLAFNKCFLYYLSSGEDRYSPVQFGASQAVGHTTWPPRGIQDPSTSRWGTDPLRTPPGKSWMGQSRCYASSSFLIGCPVENLAAPSQKWALVPLRGARGRAWDRGEATAWVGREQQEPEGSRGAESELGSEPAAGPGSQPPQAPGPDSERLLGSSQGQEPKPSWASRQRADPPGPSVQESLPALVVSQVGFTAARVTNGKTSCGRSPAVTLTAWRRLERAPLDLPAGIHGANGRPRHWLWFTCPRMKTTTSRSTTPRKGARPGWGALCVGTFHHQRLFSLLHLQEEHWGQSHCDSSGLPHWVAAGTRNLGRS